MEANRRKFKFDPSPMSVLVLMLFGLLMLQIVVLLLMATAIRLHDSETITWNVIKCCNSSSMFNSDLGNCNITNQTLAEFKVPKNVVGNEIRGEYERTELQLSPKSKIWCKDNTKYTIYPHKDVNHSFQVSREGILIGLYNTVLAKQGQFCIERDFQTSNIDVMVCQPKAENNINQMYAVGIKLSIPFLLCTFLVYALIRKLQNLHGKSLMCHVVTMSMAYIGLLNNEYIEDKNDSLCKTVAYVTQFSFLACFYWLNTMCFDLWWTFSGYGSFVKDSKQDSQKKFKIYSAYSWGCSLLITTVTYCIQTFSLSTVLKIPDPKFGNGSCLYNREDMTSANLYFYGPIGTLILCNLFMFVHTSTIIVRSKRCIDETMKKSESKRIIKKETGRYVLYMKLFLIMGINWLIELLSYYFKDPINNNFLMRSLVDVLDIFNAMQGVIIFIIFVCKKDVIILLNKKLYPRKIFIQPQNSSINTNNNSNISKNTSSTRCSIKY